MFRFVNNRDIIGQGEFDTALAEFFKRVAIGLEFVPTGVAASNRTTLIADMLGDIRGRKAKGAGSHRLFNQGLDLHDFLLCCAPLHRLFAHHKVAKRSQRGHKTDIDAAPALFGRIHIFGEGDPIPGHAFAQHVKRDGFHVDQVPGGDFLHLRLTRGQADPTIAHYQTRDPMPGRRRDERIPANLGVIVSVRINKARCHNQVGGIHDLLGSV